MSVVAMNNPPDVQVMTVGADTLVAVGPSGKVVFNWRAIEAAAAGPEPGADGAEMWAICRALLAARKGRAP